MINNENACWPNSQRMLRRVSTGIDDMAFVVLYDACVLFPAPLRDLLLRVGVAGLVQVKWTDKILDECFVT